MADKSICCKCKSEQSTVLIRFAPYCQKCFLYVFVGKYRSILLRLKPIERVRGKVLLACSGGPSSMALVNLTNDFIQPVPEHKKKIQLVPSAVICHIDESTLFGNNHTLSEQLGQNMREKYQQFPYVSHRLEEVFGKDFMKDPEFNKVLLSATNGVENTKYEHMVNIDDKSSALSPAEQLVELFKNIKNATAKEDLLWHLKMAMLVQVAKREGCVYIFMGDSSTRQAIKMISLTSKGRGYSLALDIGVENQKSFKDVGIMRPMKDMLTKEIGFYNHFVGINQYVITTENYSTKMPGKSSIGRLTEEFIVGLERDFPSTVSTVCRTTTKLNPASDMDTGKSCAICLMPIQPGINEWRKHITVTNVPEGNNNKQEGCDSCNSASGCCGGKDKANIDLNSQLCYSCQVNLKDYNEKSIELLAPYVAEKVYDQSRDERLRDQIKDFLIEDDDEEEQE
ncbi:hypothetical protein K501DRAFT_216726 [Backusella circina FSU 941]|nr:hypothetical protein K501DRAFT_216726 [Backusella circina FSU 941]